MGKPQGKPSRQDATIKPRCPEVRRSWYNGVDLCNLNDKICLLEGPNECPYYNDYLKEVEASGDAVS